MVQWAFRVILFICGTKVTVIGGEENLKDQGGLIASETTEAISILSSPMRCPRLTGYIAKRIWKDCRCCALDGACTVCFIDREGS